MRILYFMVKYPEFSETYMHEEIRSLQSRYEIQIVSYAPSREPRKSFFPYRLIPYLDTCLVYGRFEKVNRRFTNLRQRWFLHRVGKVIEAFRPHVLHGHYFGLALLLNEFAERHRVPYTIRTHSMDMLSEPPQKLSALCEAVRSPWCLRVLCFPAFREALIGLGAPQEKVVSCWPVLNYRRFRDTNVRPRTGRVLCAGPAIRKKRHNDFVDLAARVRGGGVTFDLYARGPTLKATRAYNTAKGNPIKITYADPDEMPQVYRQYDWLVYPSDQTINKVGFPVSIVEAQASGIGVCWQELPGRRHEQLDFLGGAGYLFRSIEEIPSTIGQAYPEEMRLRGIENARKCDVEAHNLLLTEAWDGSPQAAGE